MGIDTNLLYWQGFIRQKCKQRLVKITQYLIRMRKLKLKRQKKLVPLQRKIERRERRREEKALVAARLDNHIEKELLERLKKGTYGDIYNFSQKAFEKALENEVEEEEIEKEVEDELEADYEDGERVFVEDFEESDDDMEDIGDEDMENLDLDTSTDEDSSDDDEGVKEAKKPGLSKPVTKKGGKKRKSLKPHVEIEYETEEAEREKLKA